MGRQNERTGPLGRGHSRGLFFIPVAQENKTLLEQVYYQFWIMREGWLVDPGTNWVWRFHRDDKAWVRDPKEFKDRGMAMPNVGRSLLTERRHLAQEDHEIILNSMGWREEGRSGGR